MKTFFVAQKTNLKDFTDSVYPQGSFCLAALLRAKDVKVNGLRVNKNVPLDCGDEVVYYTSPQQEQKPSHGVVYEDGNVYIADKASGVSCEGLLSELSKMGEFYAVHRLDRNTEGLVIFAKTKSAEEELLSAFKERLITKKYIALCKNKFKQSCAYLTAYLVKDKDEAKVKLYSAPRANAVIINTEFRILEYRGDSALAEITLHTGKTHQIRAHMAFIGCPVLGDEKYGDESYNKKYAARRQRLIAKYLSFNLSGSLSYLNCKTFESKYGL